MQEEKTLSNEKKPRPAALSLFSALPFDWKDEHKKKPILITPPRLIQFLRNKPILAQPHNVIPPMELISTNDILGFLKPHVICVCFTHAKRLGSKWLEDTMDKTNPEEVDLFTCTSLIKSLYLYV
jgi:hypothetical protein